MRHLATLDLPVESLRTFPGNARRSDLDAIAQSLERNGQYRAIVVMADNADDPAAGGTIVAGNHTMMAGAEKLGWTHIRAEMIECTMDEARRFVLADNRLTDKAKYDQDALVELLKAAAVDGLEGTGWSDKELETMAGVLPEPGDAEIGETLQALYGVTVEVDTEAEQVDLLERLAGEGWRVRALLR